MKVCQENPNLVKIKQKYWEHYMEMYHHDHHQLYSPEWALASSHEDIGRFILLTAVQNIL
jgi:hypothetical protein